MTKIQCVSSDFYWYDDSCHAEPRCRMDNLGGCETEDECTALGAFWYDGFCSAEPACMYDSLAYCDTAERCESSGFYWYDGVCKAESPCGPDNLAGCTTEADCVVNGGEWHNYLTSSTINCTEKSTTTTSTSTGSTSTTSTNWFEFLLGATACSPDQLDTCDQQGCESLGDGYYWYNASCHDEPQQEALCWQDSITDAPCRFGSDVDDGRITAGDSVSLNITVPETYEMKRYVILVFSGGVYAFIRNDNLDNPFSGVPAPLLHDGYAEYLFECPDLCVALPGYHGEWWVFVFTVPAEAAGFQSLEELATYLDSEDGQYILDFYGVTVDCRSLDTLLDMLGRL